MLTLAEEVEQASRRYAALAELADAAIERRDHSILPSLLRSAELAHDKLHKIRLHVREEQVALGSLIPREEGMKVIRKYLEPMKIALDALPQAVGKQCNPTDPDLAFMVLQGWVDRLLHSVTEGLEESEKAPAPMPDQDFNSTANSVS